MVNNLKIYVLLGLKWDYWLIRKISHNRITTLCVLKMMRIYTPLVCQGVWCFMWRTNEKTEIFEECLLLTDKINCYQCKINMLHIESKLTILKFLNKILYFLWSNLFFSKFVGPAWSPNPFLDLMHITTHPD